MSAIKFDTARSWFEKLRDNLISDIEGIDNETFSVTKWDHKDKGGGIMSKIKGNVIEKGILAVEGGVFIPELVLLIDHVALSVTFEQLYVKSSPNSFPSTE